MGEPQMTTGANHLPFDNPVPLRPAWVQVLAGVIGIMLASDYLLQFFLGPKMPDGHRVLVTIVLWGILFTSALWWAHSHQILAALPLHRRKLFPVRIFLLLPLLGLTFYRLQGEATHWLYWSVILAISTVFLAFSIKNGAKKIFMMMMVLTIFSVGMWAKARFAVQVNQVIDNEKK